MPNVDTAPNGVMAEDMALRSQSHDFARRDPPASSSEQFGAWAMLVLVIAATALYFVAARPLWAVALLALPILLGLLLPIRLLAQGFARAAGVFLLLTFAINALGIAYPYSNILTLTGLLGLFALSGMSWKALYFMPGKTRAGHQSAFWWALAVAGAILLVYFLKPALLGSNPSPRNWPPDVIVIMAIGYATFSALMEETIFRGVLLAYLERSFRAEIAVAVQALLFAIMHYGVGFPQGLAGAALALLWGLAAGRLVKKTESIYPAYLMHFLIVLILFLVLAFS